MENNKPKNNRFIRLTEALIEMGFIIFLFYANLLMGEYTETKNAQVKGLLWAIDDIFTITNFLIAVITAMAGHFVFRFLRKKI